MLVKVARSCADADARVKQLQRDFEAAFVANSAPKDAALFRHRQSLLVCLYFSPAAVRIFPELSAYSPEPCTEPSSRDASLFVGHRDARNLLKP